MDLESKSNNDITVIILTYNESLHIQRCIESVQSIASEIVVIDSHSTDDTVKIAENFGARVLCNDWKNHSTQFNWGLDNADIKTEWVFRIDADEYLDTGKDNLLKLNGLSKKISGIYIQRKYFFMGKWIKHGAMYPSYHLRIWRHPHGRIEDRWMDERTILNQGEATNLAISIIDDNLNSLEWWISKHNRYATREMVDSINLTHKFMDRDGSIKNLSGRQAIIKRIAKEKIYSSLPLFVRPFPLFIYRYIFRLGFLDGTRGFIFHFLQAFWYRMLVDFKVYEANKKLNGESDPVKIKSILREHTLLDI